MLMVVVMFTGKKTKRKAMAINKYFFTAKNNSLGNFKSVDSSLRIAVIVFMDHKNVINSTRTVEKIYFKIFA